MKNLIKADICYMFMSKSIFGCFLLFGIFCFANSWMSYQYANQSFQQYSNISNYMVEAGADIETELSKEYIVHEDNNIENPLPFFKDQVENSLSNTAPQNVFISFAEACTLFSPIIAVLIATLLVSSDEKNKTSRLKVARNGKIQFIISKQISGIILIIAILFLGFILTVIFNQISYTNLESNYDLTQFKIKTLNRSNMFYQIIYILFEAIIFFEIGYTISNIFHCYTILSIIVSFILFFAPPFFKYDPMNLKCYFEKNIFLFEGVIHQRTPIPISTHEAVIELLIIIISILAINSIVTTKRSAYN